MINFFKLVLHVVSKRIKVKREAKYCFYVYLTSMDFCTHKLLLHVLSEFIFRSERFLGRGGVCHIEHLICPIS